jgi:hypothetical protein
MGCLLGGVIDQPRDFCSGLLLAALGQEVARLRIDEFVPKRPAALGIGNSR